MLVGRRIGPFTIEKEIGAGAMGAVYRARHGETGQRVAVKIVAPGLASNPTALARFQRESAILRQLNHPNIVRLVATGKFQGTPFYAMEYIEGESLDRVMARRGRISWEEVVQLGKQLCAALSHAHSHGIVHRDLKPSNLMVLRDGTVKLTDFGIAKDLDVTALTSANCTVGTASYMSPEQCRGERDLSHKSDLYSMGVMFYELVTGVKPFIAESTMEMFLLHTQGKFERPARIVLDIPVWLDNLICQLLEKKPDQRPYDAAVVKAALDQVQEKVEAQISAGVDVARTRVIDRAPNRTALDDQDKEAARELLGRKKKKQKTTPFYQQRWLQGAVLAALMGFIGVVLFMTLLRKPSPEELHRRAEKVLSPDVDASLERRIEARNEFVRPYLRDYKDTDPDDKRRKDMLAWADEIDRDEQEELLLRRMRNEINVMLDDAEREARKAIDLEDKGRVNEAREAWKSLVKWRDAADAKMRPLGLVAAFRLKELDGVLALEKRLTKDSVKLPPAELKKRDAVEQKAVAAIHLETSAPDQAIAAWQKLREGLERDHREQRPWVVLAEKHLNELKNP